MPEQTELSETPFIYQLAWADRRASVRYHLDEKLPCRLRSESCEGRWARIQDISTTGISLLLGARLEPGTALVVEIRGTGARSTLSLPARVVRATPHGDGNYMLGCDFVVPLSEQRLQQLL